MFPSGLAQTPKISEWIHTSLSMFLSLTKLGTFHYVPVLHAATHSPSSPVLPLPRGLDLGDGVRQALVQRLREHEGEEAGSDGEAPEDDHGDGGVDSTLEM